MNGHLINSCYAYCDAQCSARQEASEKTCTYFGKCREQANQVQDTQNASKGTEFAGNVSTCTHEPSGSSPLLQLDADFDWITDTGATSHTTPHHHWIHNYKPYCIPIQLADNSIVYLAGMGSVMFRPVIEGREGSLGQYPYRVFCMFHHSETSSCLVYT